MFLEIIQKYIMDLLKNGISRLNIVKLKGKMINKKFKNLFDNEGYIW